MVPMPRVTVHKKSSEDTAAPSENKRYIEIPLPNLASRNLSVNMLLVALLLVFAFLLGALTTKIQYLQGGSTTTDAQTPTAQASGTPPKPLHVAKAIGMDANKFKSCLQSGKYTKAVADDLALGQKAGVTGTPSVFINGNMIVGAQPFSVFETAIDQALANPNTPIPSTTPTTVDVSQGPFPVMGNPNAQVKIVEFADYQCPFCEQWFSQVEPQIIDKYVKTGKASFQFQNYAFLGADSNTAAAAAYCANDQGKFWDYHDFMYKHQGQEQSGWTSEQNLL